MGAGLRRARRACSGFGPYGQPPAGLDRACHHGRGNWHDVGMSEVVDPAGPLLRDLDARRAELQQQLEETADRATRRRIRRQIRSLLLRSAGQADTVRARHGTE